MESNYILYVPRTTYQRRVPLHRFLDEGMVTLNSIKPCKSGVGEFPAAFRLYSTEDSEQQLDLVFDGIADSISGIPLGVTIDPCRTKLLLSAVFRDGSEVPLQNPVSFEVHYSMG
jgi:hypothetical protein